MTFVRGLHQLGCDGPTIVQERRPQMRLTLTERLTRNNAVVASADTAGHKSAPEPSSRRPDRVCERRYVTGCGH